MARSNNSKSVQQRTYSGYVEKVTKHRADLFAEELNVVFPLANSMTSGIDVRQAVVNSMIKSFDGLKTIEKAIKNKTYRDKNGIEAGFKFVPEAETISHLIEPVLEALVTDVKYIQNSKKVRPRVKLKQEFKGYSGGKTDFLIDGYEQHAFVECKKVGYYFNTDPKTVDALRKVSKNNGDKLLRAKTNDEKPNIVRGALYGQMARYFDDYINTYTGDSLGISTNGIFYHLFWIVGDDTFTADEFEDIEDKYTQSSGKGLLSSTASFGVSRIRTGFWDKTCVPFMSFSIFDEDANDKLYHMAKFVASFCNNDYDYLRIKVDMHDKFFQKLKSLDN